MLYLIKRKITPKIKNSIGAEEFKASKGGANLGSNVPSAAPMKSRPKENLSMLNMK
ncbi:MAG: hypothetical protein QXZ13_02855 [Candidatus Diapherotrites archaeon]